MNRVITVVLMFLICIVIQFAFFTPSVEQEIEKTCADLNKSCPKMVDTETRLDRLVAGPGKRFAYEYTLVNYSLESIGSSLEELKQVQSKELNDTIRNDPQMRKQILDRGITMMYRYADKDGKLLFEVEIVP